MDDSAVVAAPEQTGANHLLGLVADGVGRRRSIFDRLDALEAGVRRGLRRLCVVLLLLPLAVACGGGGGGGGSGGISAVIDGVPWTSATVSEDAQVGTFGVILIQGSQNGTTIQIVLYNVDSVGTYRLGMGGTNVGGYAQVTDLLPRGWS